MFVRFCVILIFAILLEWKLTQSAPADVGKGKEKVRAYEFGYSIEENQHRHEKRDENGIVMGEFGFITADGIYHVTVYATDENGKFKILAMKSFPYRSPEKKITAVTPPPVRMPDFKKAIPSDTKSCGGCVLPKKNKPNPADVNKKLPDNSESLFRPLSKTISDNESPLLKAVPAPVPAVASKSPPAASSQPQPAKPNAIGQSKTSATGGSQKPAKPNAIGQPKTSVTGGNGKTYPLTTLQTTGPPKGSSGEISVNRIGKALPSIDKRFGFEEGNPTTPSSLPSSISSSKRIGGSSTTQTPLLTTTTQRQLAPPQNTIQTNTAKVPTQSIKNQKPSQSPLPAKSVPSLTPRINAPTPTPTQNTNKYTPGQVQTSPGSQQQTTNVPKTQTATTKLTPLPQSISAKLTPSTNGGGPLYRFNYVLDYNSHREEGRIDGSKEGNYKTIDEDGIRRIVEYIANENGFQPHIKWERVPVSELPTGDNKLKEYEFVWFNKS